MQVKPGPLVACDDELWSSFKSELETAGYRVVSLHDAPLDRVAAVVLSRLDSNLMGITQRQTPAVVLNAAGMTPREVVRELEQRLGQPG